MSSGELIVIVFVIMMLFGPKKIPEIARMIGKFMRQFKRITDDFKEEINQEEKKKNSEVRSQKSEESDKK